MKKLFYCLALISVLFLGGCIKEPPFIEEPKAVITFELDTSGLAAYRLDGSRFTIESMTASIYETKFWTGEKTVMAENNIARIELVPYEAAITMYYNVTIVLKDSWGVYSVSESGLEEFIFTGNNIKLRFDWFAQRLP